MKTLKKFLAGTAGATALLGAIILPAAPVQAAGSAGYSGKGCTAYTYEIGDYSSCVGYIQRILNAESHSGTYYGYFGGYQLDVDNSFGSNTEVNVTRFQSFWHLTADGIVGPDTWNKLCFNGGYYGNHDSTAPAHRQDQWWAAYDAGCNVEIRSGSSYTVINKY